MTVPYSAQLPKSFSTIGWFRAVVFRWRGSIFKLVLLEMIGFMLLWYVGFTVIRLLDHSDVVEALKVVTFMRTYQSSTRTLLSFMLVYYYQQIYARAKAIFFSIPFPDNPFFMLNTLVGKSDERGRLLRCTCIRYILATTFMVYHGTSSKFTAAYPDPFTALMEQGILTEGEVDQLQLRLATYPYMSEISVIPLAWAQSVICQGFEEGQVGVKDNPFMLHDALDAVRQYRLYCADLLFQAYLPFPAMLSQLVTVLTYTQIIVTVLAQQNTDKEDEPTFYFPLFTSIESLVYIGALRVGQVYTNPLGNDDDDYETVSFHNRNLKLAHIYGLFGDHPSLDVRNNQPPMQSLSGLQANLCEHIPNEFYSYEHSHTGLTMRRSHPSYRAPNSPGYGGRRETDGGSVVSFKSFNINCDSQEGYAAFPSHEVDD